MATITIFGSSQAKEGEPDYETGKRLGKLLAESGYTVCNGGYGGMMEATARGAREGRGKTIGVTTGDFKAPANPWIDREIRVNTWRERLFKLIELADACVVFNGGTGTLAELFVVWEMSNKKFLSKPLIVFSPKLESLIRQIQSWPEVIQAADLDFADGVDKVLGILKEGFGTGSGGTGTQVPLEC